MPTPASQPRSIGLIVPCLVIKQKVEDWNALHPGLRFLVVNWYELLDADTWYFCLDLTPSICKEYHFGVMRSDWTKKLGFNALKVRFLELGSP